MEQVKGYEFVKTFFDFNFTTFILFSVVFIFIAFLFTELIRRLSRNNKRGYAVYAVLAALIAAVFPIRIKIFPSVINVGMFDFLFWIKKGEPHTQGVGLVGKYSTFTENDPPYITFSQVLFAIWLIGVFVSLMTEIVRYMKLKKSVKKYSVRCDNEMILALLNEECHMKKTPELLIYDMCPTPFAMGIFQPKILIPSEDYSPEEIKLILRHELEHIRRRDIPVKMLMVFLRALNWFNPIIYILCSNTFEDMEISVDEKVTEDIDTEYKKIYSELILKTAANSKMSDISTYLSLDGKRLKARISSVLLTKKSSFVPTLLTFCAVFFVCLYVAPSDNAFGSEFISPYGIYVNEIPMESDPVITDESLRTVEADSYESAARIYTERCLEKYSLDTMPDYYRVENYMIWFCKSAAPVSSGLINEIDTRLVNVGYYFDAANDCGNTVFDEMYMFTHFNGLYYNERSYDVRKIGKDLYHIDNIGLATTAMINTDRWHFNNDIPYMERYFGVMAAEGLFDKDESDSEIVDRKMHAVNSRGDLWENPESNGMFEYCGYDFDFESRTVTIYGNVYTDKSHGVKIISETPDEYFLIHYHNYHGQNVTIFCTDLYPHLEYNDRFDKIDFDNISDDVNIGNAEKRLEYMMTPRGNTDFTVLAYKNITEKDGGIYADVRFKGRLEGTYSVPEFINEHGGENEWYLENVRIM